MNYVKISENYNGTAYIAADIENKILGIVFGNSFCPDSDITAVLEGKQNPESNFSITGDIYGLSINVNMDVPSSKIELSREDIDNLRKERARMERNPEAYFENPAKYQKIKIKV